MRIVPQDSSEEGRAGGEDELVSLDLTVANRKGAIEEIFLFSKFPKGDTDVAFEIIPAEAKFLAGRHFQVETASDHALSWRSPGADNVEEELSGLLGNMAALAARPAGVSSRLREQLRLRPKQ